MFNVYSLNPIIRYMLFWNFEPDIFIYLYYFLKVSLGQFLLVEEKKGLLTPNYAH